MNLVGRIINAVKRTPQAKAIGDFSRAPQLANYNVAVMASTLPPVPLPKSKGKPQTLPGFRTSLEVKTSALRRVDRQLASNDRLSARSLGDTRKTIVELTRSSPDLNSAMSFMLRTGIPEKFTVVARSLDGKLDPAATMTAQELLRRLTYMGNMDGSFGSQMSLQSLSEMLGMELIHFGSACVEVALDKAKVPASMNPVSTTTLKIYEEDNSFRLVQDIGGTEIDLDLPTIIYVTVDQLQTEAYSTGYFDGAIQPVLADIDFNNDVRRALKRSVLPRVQAIIDGEAVKKGCPPDIFADGDKFVAYKNALLQSITDALSSMNPEDAIVSYDSVEYSYLPGGEDPSAIVERMQKVLNGKLSSGAKTLPVILGHANTSNAASAESMLYIKQANMLRVKLNEIYSRALTVAVRLLGVDVYVEFVYEQINLRPDSELEAFKAMNQSRVLEQLSYGFITDEEASIALTGNLPPAGFKPLSGTQFLTPVKADPGGNKTSNTSAQEQSLKSKSPQEPKD